MADTENSNDLIKMLNDQDAFTRKRAVKQVEHLEDKSVLDKLSQMLLTDPSPLVRHTITLTFKRKLNDKKLIDVLVKALEDQDAYVRAGAVSALGSIPDKAVIPFICQALQDEEVRVRMAAILQLNKIGDERAVPALKRLAHNYNEPPQVREAVADTISKIEKK